MGNVVSQLVHPILIVFVAQGVLVDCRWWEVEPPCETPGNPVEDGVKAGVDGYAIVASVLTAFSWFVIFLTAWVNRENVRDFNGVGREVRRWRQGEEDANVECVKLRNDCYQLKLASREKEVEHQQLLEEVKSLKVRLGVAMGEVPVAVKQKAVVGAHHRGSTRGPHLQQKPENPN